MFSVRGSGPIRLARTSWRAPGYDFYRFWISSPGWGTCPGWCPLVASRGIPWWRCLELNPVRRCPRLECRVHGAACAVRTVRTKSVDVVLGCQVAHHLTEASWSICFRPVNRCHARAVSLLTAPQSHRPACIGRASLLVSLQ